MHPSVGQELRDRLIGSAVEGTGGIRYHLRELLGEGGQGWVYKANYDDPDGFWIVVKLLRPDDVNADALKRFEREAEVLRMLGAVPAPNPNIVRFYDYGVHTVHCSEGEVPIPFIALEHVEGQTLGKVIAAHGGFGLPLVRVRRIMKQVARALHTVHERRIVHRDLKPSNILLAQLQGQELAKVTDFGLVKLPELSNHKTVTVAGASLGYAPPEQYEMGNNRVSVQTDVFSFATILYEMLSGSEAFPYKPGDNPLRIVARMLSGERPALARVSAAVPRELRDRPDLTASLDREIARAVAADPTQRHASIRELWERVEPILSEAAAKGGPLDEPSTFDPSGSSVPSGPVSVSMPEWRMVGRAMTGERLRSATISADGKTIVAVGSHGLYHFARGIWSALHLPARVDARSLRGIRRMPAGELLLFGDGGLAMVLAASGAAERIEIGDRDVNLLGAHADAQGVTFVGERLSRPIGVVVELVGGAAPTLRSLEGTTRLHAVARVDPATVIACGALGDLVEITSGGHRDIPWGRTGHLYAITARPAAGAVARLGGHATAVPAGADGVAYAVGSGGHALQILPGAIGPGGAPGLRVATLEPVQTTRDLNDVVLDHDGGPWAAAGQGRLLHRRQGVWARVPVDSVAQGQLITVSARADGVTVLGDDGVVLEGRGIG